MSSAADAAEKAPKLTITPLLKRLWPQPASEDVSASEIALAISHIFTNSLTDVQTGALLTALHFTGRDRQADVIAKCAEAMRDAAAPVDEQSLRAVIKRRGKKEGTYRGGLCDIVGTGGDSHSTFNISTTSSILASSLLLIAKHGNRASTSMSGSADLLSSTLPTAPVLSNAAPTTLSAIYAATNYAFLFAPVFHKGMKYVAHIRRQLGWRTIFNLLGPLANPVEALVEARVVGVARRDMGPAFADALRMSGARKAMVVCGEEDLDELSCAGRTFCWRLVERANPAFRGQQAGKGDEVDGDEQSDETSDDDAPPRTVVEVEAFTLSPEDFGLPPHPLSEVSPGKEPHENAAILMRLLRGEMARDDPIMHFVLINTAALFVVSGVCEADESSMGPGDDGKVIKERGPGGGRWKEGVRKARWAVESGAALRQWDAFVEATHAVEKQ
ncbi:anthranilate phosphoribosyltransferase [Coniosporium apollinis CBS 100218]|uniref:Anthranilate phosphoribosyltransferase n=1 Tax=Coniosporium apollinis (strain CBS 100218) TaxID=1168221 RepID=R7YZW9_CONA1|nr:anthranilate phosphoribosyltransferase [Coniosporium apollinis CBS 100218]EON67447.1 anthranilate phosphoribosyltransferase [Coniosporium apollinis CBS 100218]